MSDEPLRPAGIRARGLTVRGRHGTVVGPLDLDVAPGRLVVVEGPSGSGRSVLLLALTGRMAGIEGELEVAGVPERQGRRLRAVTSVARISDLIDLDDPLTVAECVTERCLADGIRVREGNERMSELFDVLDFRVPRDAHVGDLSSLERVLFMVLLAQLRPAALTVLDDLDHDLTPSELDQALHRITGLTGTGVNVAVSTVAAPVDLPAGTVLVRLPRQQKTAGPML